MDDLECPQCGADLLELSCVGCHQRYETVLGVPFIGTFERTDALGLIEIAAAAPRRHQLVIPVGWVDDLDRTINEYHNAPDKAEYVAQNPSANVWYFESRYTEWLALQSLLVGVDLRGAKVLDIGAGQGVDSKRLALKGAKVTALEFSPLLSEAGQKNFPDIRWIGGLGHALPFKNGSFDAVFCNAALHHMKSVPATIAEALRVLRTGGTLITTGDPFCADTASQYNELHVFDRHAAVLLGINEQIPKFSDFVDILLANPDAVKIDFFTSHVHGGRSGNDKEVTEWTRWNLATDQHILKHRAGTIAMKITLLKPWPHPRRVQTEGALKPAQFSEWLVDQSIAMSNLATVIPETYINRPFPGQPSKFDLLNGWRLPSPTAWRGRKAYQRARWYLKRNDRSRRLSFAIRSPTQTSFTILREGRTTHQMTVGDKWVKTDIDISNVPANLPFVLEIRRDEPCDDFDNSCFEVRSRRMDGETFAERLRSIYASRSVLRSHLSPHESGIGFPKQVYGLIHRNLPPAWQARLTAVRRAIGALLQ